VENTSNVQYSILPAIGYTLQTRLAVILAGNMTFKLSKKPGQKTSSIYANVAATQNRQLTLPLQTNIWTANNKFNLVGDYRYYVYPQSTYGLGGNNDYRMDADPMSFQYFRLYQSVMTEVGKNLYAGVGYYLDKRWNITETGYSDGRVSDYQLYGAQASSLSSGLGISLLHDSRINAINPFNGLYANVIYRVNPTWMGSNSNWQSLLVDVRKYFRLSQNLHRVLALWSYNWIITKGDPPYLDLPSTMWDSYTNTGRGFIQGRFRSKQMYYLEAEFRSDITRDGLLGGVLFANMQSLSEWPQHALKYVQPAAGFGLRVKLNKHSGTNLSVDYAFGKGGSRGLFINVGELF
jgi:outer membrane protein assembly factor BamA